MLAAHLPGYSLGFAGSAQLGPGRLEHLDLAAWRSLDSDYPFRDAAFERTRPLFYVLDVDGAVAPPVDAHDFAFGLAATAHRSLTLRAARTQRTPPPSLSLTYRREGPGIEKLIGPYGHDAVLNGVELVDPPPALTSQDVSAARTLFELWSSSASIEAVAVLLEVLDLTCRVDVDQATGFALCIGALELAIMPDARERLRETFGRRLATLIHADPADVADAADDYSNMYRLRSDLVHGKVRSSTLELFGLDHPFTPSITPARDLVRSAAMYLGCAVRGGVEPDELAEMLDRASDSAATHHELHVNIHRGAQG